MGHRPKRRRRRVRHGPDSPLTASGTVPGTTSRPPRAGWLARPMSAVIRALPSYTLDARGRGKANLIRLSIGAVALYLATRGADHLAWGGVGLGLALLLLVVPLPEHLKRRLLAWARGLGQPKELPIRVPAELSWDGAKLVVRSEGRVWRSLRPRKAACRVVVGEATGRALLGLVKEGAARDRALWFTAPREAVGETYDPLITTPGFDPSAASDTIEVSGPTFAALHEALWDASTGGLPRERGPSGS